MIRLLSGDCRTVLPTLPAQSVQCCVTSPPYWGLRDYGVEGQLGLEKTPDEYVVALVGVFREVWRVLRDDGTLWLNLGDSYARTQEGNVPQTKNAPVDYPSHTKMGSSDGVVGRADRPGSRAGAVSLKPKDLVGVPWRVAFALQQPYYTGNIKAERDRAWLAALVDGEGCITILETTSPHGSGNSYPPVLQVRMCDTECIAHAAQITGLGTTSPEQEPPSQAGQRGSFQWRLNARKAVDTIAEIYPFLLIKRKQAIVAWNHQAVRESYETKRGVKIPTAALERQQVCRDLIQRLNNREPVDIPSWMIEPPFPVEPGWYLRSDCIWAKPNPMPESVRDRRTKSHEYVFLLSKQPRYYYDAAAIAEESVTPEGTHRGGSLYLLATGGPSKGDGFVSGENHGGGVESVISKGIRNARSVWTIATQPYAEAHFATFPPELAERCIKAGTKPGDTVLDPFGGAGTVGLVADRLQRSAVLIELNSAYCALGKNRITDDAPLFAQVK